MTAAQRLRDARSFAGLTQAELAARLGVARPYIADLERGRRVPSLEWLLAAAAALGCDPAALDGRLASTNTTKPRSAR